MATKEKTTKNSKYFEAVGRRKSATARVRIHPADKQSMTINDRSADQYFATPNLQKIIHEALEETEKSGQFMVTVKVVGGGLHAQAEAIRHGLSRALVKNDDQLRSTLKKAGFLKRDPRSKERKKFGLKKARKSAQWSKR